jgi:hypothetical protein
MDVRIESLQTRGGSGHFVTALIGAIIDNLSLEVGNIDLIGINKPDRTHAGGCQIKGCRGSKTTHADDQNTGCGQFLLTFRTDFCKYHLARIPGL